MSFEDIPSRLEDSLDAIKDVQEFVAGRSFDDYVGDTMLRLATERCVEIISEASRHIPPDMKARHPEVPWQNVADIGNVLRHGYQSIDHRIMWEVVTQHLMPLRDAIEHMLRQMEPGEQD
jgi:uncharacterized protein with HEPN domain